MHFSLASQSSLAAAVAWQDGVSIFARIWSYLKHEFIFGNIRVSFASLVVGLLVIAATLFLWRTASSLLDRRLAKRGHIDAGLRYTIASLARYFVVTVGVI